MVLRPDEMAAESEIERDQRVRSKIGKGVATVAPLALGASGAFSKIMPLLNEMVPVDLAMKGINKLMPKVGKFLKKGQEMGLDVREGMDFVKEQIEKTAPKKEPAKSLFTQMLGGADPSSLPAQVQEQVQFIGTIADKFESEGKTMESPEVKKLSKKLKDIVKGKPGVAVEEIARFQSAQQPQGQMGQPMQGMQPQQQASMQAPMQGQMGQPGGGGPGQQALMEILKKIQAQRGA